MSGVRSIRGVPLIQSPLSLNKEFPQDDEQPQVEAHDATLFDNPQFQHYEETSNIQLFFDLFFVANLSSFTEAHEVNSIETLSTYIGFFCILWFTWCQVTMYDVRFSTDSVFERVAHACHFGIMVGFATVGPEFNDPTAMRFLSLQQLCLLLMASRFVLFFQYLSTLYFSWRYRTTRLPLIAVLVSLAVAAFIYLGISFDFVGRTESHAPVAWYLIAVLEVAANIVIAGKWHVLSFKGTHLTERMTCLTLIILGEGVIGLCKAIVSIEDLDFDFSSGTIGTLISALLIIYFIYQLYFDNVQLEHFGIMRQQIWTFLHFPFHMALVLLMEGIKQFVGWRHLVEFVYDYFYPLMIQGDRTYSEYLGLWNETITVIFSTKLSITQEAYEEVVTEFTAMQAPNVTVEEANHALQGLIVELLRILFDGYGFEPPEGQTEGESPLELVESYYGVFNLVFAYFFISAGLVVIMLGLLSWLSHSKGEHESRSHLVSIISKFAIGTGLVLCSTMVLTVTADNLGSSAWTLPLVFFCLAIALILNHIPWGNTGKSSSDLPLNAPRKQNALSWGIMKKSLSRKPTQQSAQPGDV